MKKIGYSLVLLQSILFMRPALSMEGGSSERYAEATVYLEAIGEASAEALSHSQLLKIFPGKSDLGFNNLFDHYTKGFKVVGKNEESEDTSATAEAIKHVREILSLIYIKPKDKTVQIDLFLNLFNVREEHPHLSDLPLFEERPKKLIVEPLPTTAQSRWQKLCHNLKMPTLFISAVGCGAFGMYMLMKSKIIA